MLTRSLERLDRHRQDDRGCLIRSFDELDAGDDVLFLGVHGQVADLLAGELEGELRAGDVRSPMIVGEVDAVFQRVVLDGAVGVDGAGRSSRPFPCGRRDNPSR